LTRSRTWSRWCARRPLPVADSAAAFDDSVSAELGPYARDGYLTEAVSFAYELAVKGPSVAA
jgi:hypothetical protein